MERAYNIAAGIIGAIIGFLFGEITGAFIALVALMIIDYITGMIKAYAKKELSSSAGFRGIARKVVILCLVAVAHLIDEYVLKTGAIAMGATTAFYIGNEGLSILENAADIGIPLPQVLLSALKQIRKKGEEDKESKEKTEENKNG